MKPRLAGFVHYLKDYLRSISLKVLLITILLLGTLIVLNYTIGIEERIRNLRPLPLSLLGFFAFYSFVFWGVWGIQYHFTKPPAPETGVDKGRADKRSFLLLLLLAPLFFAVKMIHWDLSFLIPAAWRYPWNAYTLMLLQLPAKLVLLLVMLAVCSRNLRSRLALGWTTKSFSPLPYLLLLLFMAPLVALASTRPDFLHTYPKFRQIAFISTYTHWIWPWRLLYEIAYGLDFVSIELFFRGFLVIGLARWAGAKTILPMAAFYCTIHFGKPLGECISSFAGGLALGVIAWRTRSILGGLMVHLGLAWMMELGGWIGNLAG